MNALTVEDVRAVPLSHGLGWRAGAVNAILRSEDARAKGNELAADHFQAIAHHYFAAAAAYPSS